LDSTYWQNAKQQTYWSVKKLQTVEINEPRMIFKEAFRNRPTSGPTPWLLDDDDDDDEYGGGGGGYEISRP
jgi:hypothetical protein